MADKENGTPVLIIKKKGHGDHGHHGGAWKVAYADFVTAMMAFFMVMWLVNQSPAVRAAVAAYMQDPIGFAEKVGKVGDDGAGANGPSAVDGLMSAPGSSAPAPPTIAPPTIPAPVRGKIKDAAKQLKESLSKVEAFKKLGSNVQVTVTAEGMMIDLVEDEDTSFYERGSKELTPEAVTILRAIAEQVAKDGLTAVVEGHTDSTPFKGGPGYGNWELSTDRANAARRILEEGGVPQESLLAVRGYAAQRPKYPDHPDDPRNRRVSILVNEKGAGAGSAKEDGGAAMGGSAAGAPAAAALPPTAAAEAPKLAEADEPHEGPAQAESASPGAEPAKPAAH